MSENCTSCDPPDWLVAQIKGEKCAICGMEVNEKFIQAPRSGGVKRLSSPQGERTEDFSPRQSILQMGQWFCSESCWNVFKNKRR